MLHPTPDRLEGYVDGTLDAADRAVVESHLVVCDRCQSEVEEMHALFAALASLPRLEPSPGFAERVMAGVHLHQPWPARLAALLRRLLPTSTAGWVLAAAILAIPLLTAGTATAWIVSRPWFTAQTMAVYLVDRIANLFLALAVQAIGLALESRFGTWLLEGGASLLGEVSIRGFGVAAATGSALIAGSCWVLYRYLVRTPTRDEHHVTHSI